MDRDEGSRLRVEFSIQDAQQIVRELQMRIESINGVRARYPNWDKPAITPE
jgi:hypothetical protein